jgi:drug/metabolite transporter (DMT)-like permease
MDEMREIIDRPTAERLVAIVCALWFAGVGAGTALLARRQPDPRSLSVRGGLLALLGALLYVGWRVYNAIEDHYGLDSVKALAINAALFVVTGIIIGIVAGRLSPPPVSSQEEASTLPAEPGGSQHDAPQHRNS